MTNAFATIRVQFETGCTEALPEIPGRRDAKVFTVAVVDQAGVLVIGFNIKNIDSSKSIQ